MGIHLFFFLGLWPDVAMCPWSPMGGCGEQKQKQSSASCHPAFQFLMLLLLISSLSGATRKAGGIT